LQNNQASELPVLPNQADAADPAPAGPPTAVEIERWLIGKLAEELGLKSDEIDVREPVSSYGVDSMTALTLTGDLEEWLGLTLSPTLAWDYPTVASLAEHLSEELRTAAPAGGAMPHVNITGVSTPLVGEETRQQAAALLVSLDQLSEEQVENLLSEMLTAEAGD